MDSIDSITNYPQSNSANSTVILVIGDTSHEAAEWARKHLGNRHLWRAVDTAYPVEEDNIIEVFILDGVNVDKKTRSHLSVAQTVQTNGAMTLDYYNRHSDADPYRAS